MYKLATAQVKIGPLKAEIRSEIHMQCMEIYLCNGVGVGVGDSLSWLFVVGDPS